MFPADGGSEYGPGLVLHGQVGEGRATLGLLVRPLVAVQVELLQALDDVRPWCSFTLGSAPAPPEHR